jgi:hypothetical protein
VDDRKLWLSLATKIGITGNDGVFMPMLTFMSHRWNVPEYYPYFKDVLLKYVKSENVLHRNMQQ